MFLHDIMINKMGAHLFDVPVQERRKAEMAAVRSRARGQREKEGEEGGRRVRAQHADFLLGRRLGALQAAVSAA